MNDPNRYANAHPLDMEALDDPSLPKKERIRILSLRYLGALTKIVGITSERNGQKVIVGYREGYTKGDLEQMARRYAKNAVKNGVRPGGMVHDLRVECEQNPRFGRAMSAGFREQGSKGGAR